jgi:hypothetical protein
MINSGTDSQMSVTEMLSPSGRSGSAFMDHDDMPMPQGRHRRVCVAAVRTPAYG